MSCLSNRLTEDPDSQVLLMEAGPKYVSLQIIFNTRQWTLLTVNFEDTSLNTIVKLFQGHDTGKQGPDVEDSHAGCSHLQPL